MDIRNLKIAIWGYDGNARAQLVTRALYKGALSLGLMVRVLKHPEPDAFDVFATYGVGNAHRLHTYRRFQDAGKMVVNVDMGYWRRDASTEVGKYHRVSLDHPHPQAYVMRRFHDERRFQQLDIRVHTDFPRGPAILLAGTGEKSYQMLGQPDMGWDIWAAEELRKYTRRPILYRPKPSRKVMVPIRGTILSSPEIPLARLLPTVHCVVTRHSNVGVEALAAGIPVLCIDGAAAAISGADLATIDAPVLPSFGIRRQFCWNLAHWQYTISEMMQGLLWQHVFEYKELGPCDSTLGAAPDTSKDGSMSIWSRPMAPAPPT